MRILNIQGAGTNYSHRFPDSTQLFPTWIEYAVAMDSGVQTIRLAFGNHHVFDADRAHIIAFHRGLSVAEFAGADDFR